MCQPFVSQPQLSVPGAENITISQKARLLKEDNWCGPSSLDRNLQAELDQQYSWNSAETCRFKATAFFLTYSVIKNRIRYFPLCPRIRLDIISTNFVVDKLLNTTNAVRFSVAMFSWQPLLRI